MFDIETDGLYEEVTKVHVISMCNLDANRKAIESFSDTPLPGVVGTIQDGLNRLLEAQELSGHNIIAYDFPVLRKLYAWSPKKDCKITDTLVLSRLLNPDRPLPSGYTGKSGPHGLDAWGHRTGTRKPHHEDWSVFNPDMLRRNRSDVEINHSVYHSLQSETVGWDWSEAVELEHEVARILAQQEVNGVAFNVNYARELVDELTRRIQHIDDELLPRLPCTYKPRGASIIEPFKINGTYKKVVTDWYSDIEDPACIPVHGPFTRLEAHVIDLGSISQIKDYMLKHGWVPTKWNYNDNGEQTSPKMDLEDDFGGVIGELPNLIKERMLCSHRRAQIEGWISRLRPDGRLTAGINPCGTNTGRARHHDVVNVPKAAEHVFFGYQMRSLFTASEGRVLVGHDADGLELRMLAHYMDDPEFTKAILEGKKEDGTDIHSLNQRLAGLPTRDAAKTFIYALIYGAGDNKLGQIVGGSSVDGKLLRKRFLDGLPSLKKLIERVKRASRKGFLKGIDGRKIWMRRFEGEVMEHKALNTLLQSAGAIVMKKSMIILDGSLSVLALDYQTNPTHNFALKVLDMHDEAQADVLPPFVEEYKELAELSVVKSGEHFRLKIPLAASAEAGKNWAETH